MKRVTPLVLLLLTITIVPSGGAYSIGVNYGTLADNLPPPSQVANFLKTQTTIDKIKLFDANPQILKAFAATGISVTITAITSQIPSLTKLPNAQAWVASNVLPYFPETKITTINVGNEVLMTSDKDLIAHLVPAMESLHQALQLALGNGNAIRVTSPNSLGILSGNPGPPSSGRFRRGYDSVVFLPMLEFHRRTKSPFTVNPYPFFGLSISSPASVDYALFRPNATWVFDDVTGLNYTNMFDAQMDAVFSAMSRVGFGDVGLVVGETGWPSAGDPGQLGVGLENAAGYNGNLVRRVVSGKGTPLMPNRTFETYLFALFNENLKPTVSERNYGLFRPDFSPVYDIGVLKDTHSQAVAPAESPEARAPESPEARAPETSSNSSSPSPSGSGSNLEDKEKKWCVARSKASDDALQKNIDFVCGSVSPVVDCHPIQPGGSCYDPNNLTSHASYAMNAYFHASGSNHDFNCDFNHTGLITHFDPSYKSCKYIVQAEADVKIAAKSTGAAGGVVVMVGMWSLFNVFVGLATYVSLH